ncbi:MAG: Dehydrogenase [Candidatus Alkanophagales archaeon MCA70_species_1]|nr:Dehydrogenase [Candidatus Alkanophaga volatiphilum]
MEFDEILRSHAVDAGAEFFEVLVKEPLLKNKSVVGVRGKHDGNITEINSEVVIAADGAFSALTRYLLKEERKRRANVGVAVRAYFSGVESFDFVEFHYEQKLLPGYGWIFPIGDDMANVGVGVMPAHRKINLNAYFKRFITGATRLKDAKQARREAGSSRRAAAATNGILFIGDAASFVNPLTGEGSARKREACY